MASYSIERLSISNIRHLQTLYKAVFGRKVSLEFLLKKYDTRFSGAEFIGYLALAEDNSPAAFYGVLPCRFRLKGATILAAQSADTMTHPDHRRAGLFVKLARKTYRLAGDSGIKLIFGFPNQNSLPGFIKLNWTFLPSSMKVFSIPASPFPISRVIARNSIAQNLYTRLLRALYRAEENPLNLPFPGDGVVKDDAFVRYKAYSNSYVIRVDEVRVWTKTDRTFNVGYVDMNTVKSMETFLKKLRKLAASAGFGVIVFITAENSDLFKALSRVATPQDGFPIGFYTIEDGKWDFSSVVFEHCDIDIF